MSVCERLLPCGLCPAVAACDQNQESHTIWLLDRRLSTIRRRVLVLSNKGGVGKSTLTANVAIALVRAGQRVGLLDADLSGPSLQLLLGVETERFGARSEGLLPVEPMPGLKLVAPGHFLHCAQDSNWWRESFTFDFLSHMLADPIWGELDYLLVDMPPATSGKIVALSQLIGRVDGVLLVTTAQRLALEDARRAVAVCRDAGLPVVGLVENLSGPPFGRGGGELAAVEMGIPFLGRVPIDDRVVALSDLGSPPVLVDPAGPAALAFTGVAARLHEHLP